jgi:eukaryotic-like serine/threonine-protein kinase
MVSAYRVERAIGAGGMGCVYRAYHVLEHRIVAIKVLREAQLRQDRAVDRMMREAQVLATVGHPGIPQLFECGLLSDGRPWIAMELVEGTSLALRLVEGAVPHEDVMRLIAAIAAVLAAAHTRGIIHRDLKPENILLTPLDARFPVRVIDWGIALQDAGARYTRHNEAIGTPTYMAPEQARGAPTHGACDVYGLGVVAYHALCGRPPFTGKTSVEILVQHLHKPVPELAPRCPGAPRELIALIERMLAKHPDDRPSAEQVQATLVELQGGCVAGELEEPATVRLRRIAVE